MFGDWSVRWCSLDKRIRWGVASVEALDTWSKYSISCVIACPTGCGKTTFVTHLLLYTYSSTGRLEKRLWFYGEWQPSYMTVMETTPNVEFVEGLPDVVRWKNEELGGR